jgi:hypothetical protein
MDSEYAFFIPRGVAVQVIGQKFYSDKPRTEYELQVEAAIRAAIAAASTRMKEKRTDGR